MSPKLCCIFGLVFAAAALRAPQDYCREWKSHCSRYGRNSRCMFFNPDVKRTISNNCCSILDDLCQSSAMIPTSEGSTQNCADIAKLRREALLRINVLRQHHHTSPLINNVRLEGIAQAYAEKLIQDTERGISVRHSVNGYGETIFRTWGGQRVYLKGWTPVDRWYDEVFDYNWSNPGHTLNGKKIGHFTQLIWAASEEVGVGVAFAKDCKNVIVVANYDPAGNTGTTGSGGDFERNVRRA